MVIRHKNNYIINVYCRTNDFKHLMCDHALNASVLILHHTYIESSYKTEKSKKQNKQDKIKNG